MRAYFTKNAITVLLTFAFAVSELARTAAALEAKTSFDKISAVWAVDDGEKIERYDLANPLKNDNSVWSGSEISIFGARNEVVAFQVIIESGPDGANDVSVAMSEFTNGQSRIANDFTLPGADQGNVNNSVGRRIELFREHYLHVTEPSRTLYIANMDNLIGVGWWPDPLIPFEVGKQRGGAPFDIVPRSNQAVWIDIYVPKGAPPGDYVGTLTVTENNGAKQLSFPVTLTIYDFALPDENHLRTLAYIGDPRRIAERHGLDNAGSDEYYLIEREYFKMAHRHRIDAVTDRDLDWVTENEAGYLNGRFYEANYGYEGPGEDFGNQIFLPVVEAWGSRRNFENSVKGWYDWFNSRGLEWGKALYYIWDEPGPDDYAWIKGRAEWDHALTHPMKVFVTEQINDDLMKGAAPEYIDFWCPAAAEGAWGYDVARAAGRQAAGCEVGTYNGHRPGAGTVLIDDDAIAMRTWGWIAFKHNIDLWYYWDVTYWRDYQGDGEQTDLWNDPLTFDSSGRDWENLGNGDGTLFYPGQDAIYPSGDRGVAGPISSVRMKNWRRGLQDYDYLYVAASRGLRAEAEAIVNGLIPKVMTEAAGLSEKSWPSRSAPWETARRGLADLIVGVTVEPDIVLSPNALDFGMVHTGNSFRKVVTISNDGTAALNVTSVSCDAPGFQIVSPELPQSISPGAELYVVVEFAPDAPGAMAGNLIVLCDDPDEGEAMVALSGEGGTAEGAFPDWAYQARIVGEFFWPDYTDADIQNDLNALASRGATVVVCDCPLGWSYSAWVDDAEFAENLNLARRVTATGHALGLKIVWYLTGLEVTSEEGQNRNPGDEHPDWIQIAIDGRPIVFNNISNQSEHWLEEGQWDAWLSPSGAYRDFFLDRVEQVAGAGVDGLWIDTVYLQYSIGQYDEMWPSFDPPSLAGFNAQYGAAPPGQEDWESLVWRQWIAWRHWQISDFLLDAKNRAKAVNPNLVFLEENWNVDSAGALFYANDPTEYCVFPDVTTGHEISTIGDRVDIGQRGMATASVRQWQAFITMVKFARGVDRDKPSWILTYGYEPRDAAKLAGVVLANACQYYETQGPEMSGSVDEGYREEMFSWIEEHKDVIYEPRPAAKVAVLFSARTRDMLDQGWGDFYSLRRSKFFAAYRRAAYKLLARGVRFDIITEAQLGQPGLLDSYQYVVLPLVTHLSDRDVGIIQDFTDNGGKLVVTGNRVLSGLYDEWGNQRPGSPIADLSNTSIRNLIAAVDAVRAPSSIYRELIRSDEGGAPTLYLWLVNLNRRARRARVRVKLPPGTSVLDVTRSEPGRPDSPLGGRNVRLRKGTLQITAPRLETFVLLRIRLK